MAEAASLSPGLGGRHQRRVKNYLLDTHFQLKYSAYLVLLAVVLSGGLGWMLFRVSSQVIDQGKEVVAKGREVVGESQKVSAVVQMNIIKDPVYSDNPALLEAFKADAAQQDERLKKQQETLQAQAAALVMQRKVMLSSLFGGLTLLCILIGFGGIMVTHRVAGPIYKMKMNLKAVADGHLRVPTPLRKGDELVEFFETYRSMVIALRGRQEEEIGRIEKAIAALEPKTGAGEIEMLQTLRRDMKAALDT